VKFKWGGITSFPAYVTSVSAKYTLFSADGTPIRAVCTVSLQPPCRKCREFPPSPCRQTPCCLQGPTILQTKIITRKFPIQFGVPRELS